MFICCCLIINPKSLMAAPPPPPPPSGNFTKRIPVAESTPSPKPTPPQPRQQGQMDAVISQLSNAIGIPKEFINDEPEYVPSPNPRGYKPPPSLPKGGTQGEEKVFYTINGPKVVKVQNFATFQLFCRNEQKQLVDIDSSILETEMTEEKTGEVSNGVIARERKGVFKVQFRGRSEGKYNFNIYVKGRMEKKPIYNTPVEFECIPHDPVVTKTMHFTAAGFGLQGGSVGKSYSFYIEIKDDEGHPMNCDVYKLQVFVSQGLNKVAGNIDNVALGKYKVEFTPFAPGEMVVSVTYGSQPVIETTIQYSVGIDASKTLIVNPLHHALIGQQNTFTIQAKGSNGQDLNTGGEKFDVACSGPAGGVTGLAIRDELTGKYNVRFTLAKSGCYKIFVSLNGADIGGSPMEIDAR